MKQEFNNGSAYFGDALGTIKQIKSDSVDSVITSPPYYQLRDYGFNEQWGLESDYKDYLNRMLNLMSELKRVLKPTGTMWINLGDTYSSKTKGTGGMNSNKLKSKDNNNFQAFRSMTKTNTEVLKSLMLIPHRFAIRCIDELGLILRNDIIWAKPNGMPESVTDRFSKKHEFVFFFVKNQEYYFDLDSIRDKQRESSLQRAHYAPPSLERDGYRNLANPKTAQQTYNKILDGVGKNPGDVSDFWEITTKPNSKNHYATYNSELIRKPLIAGSPVGGVILDCFGGTGTTCFSAVQFDRRFIYIDANKEYYDNFVKEMSYQDSHYKLNFDSDLQKVN